MEDFVGEGATPVDGPPVGGAGLVRMRAPRLSATRSTSRSDSMALVSANLTASRPVKDAKAWHEQLTRLIDMAGTSSAVIQVLPFTSGAPHLMDGSLTLLWQDDGSAVAYTEGNGCAELIEDPAEVTRYRLSYDRLRDLALPPPESVAFIRGVLEEHRS
ncbi:Scr1 family TA system antitoxin-like transcriptional regulator [Streptomyces sp. NPDC097727]|uniref:Scr1 family TA system antitoxin-like transcriptional regulator n=1 Tax=Streptomyces sp. NPDC097727 TaxID=3366092 RepID=UPI003818041E